MKDVMEKIPGSFRKMMAKEVIKQENRPDGNAPETFLGKNDDDGTDCTWLTPTYSCREQCKEKFQESCEQQGNLIYCEHEAVLHDSGAGQ